MLSGADANGILYRRTEEPAVTDLAMMREQTCPSSERTVAFSRRGRFNTRPFAHEFEYADQAGEVSLVSGLDVLHLPAPLGRPGVPGLEPQPQHK